MIRPIIISAIILSSITACKTQNNPPTQMTTISKNDNDVQILKGQDITTKNSKLMISYKELTEDSRCPVGVTCVWAGVAVVNVEVSTVSARPRIIQLATMDVESKNLKNKQIIYGYELTLKSVNPYPDHSGKNKDLQEKIILDIKKID